MLCPRAACRGLRARFGYDDGRPQGTSCHSAFGYEAVKHPFLGAGVRAIVARQASRLAASSADGCGAALGAEVGSAGWAWVANDDIGPASRLAANRMPRNLATRPCAEVQSLMGGPL